MPWGLVAILLTTRPIAPTEELSIILVGVRSIISVGVRVVTRLRLVILPLGAKRNAGKGAIMVAPLASILGVPFRSRASLIFHYLLLTISPTSFKLRVILVWHMPFIPGLSRDVTHSHCVLFGS